MIIDHRRRGFRGLLARARCRLRGHELDKAWATIPGITWIAECRHCGAFVEQDCEVKSMSGSSTHLRVIR